MSTRNLTDSGKFFNRLSEARIKSGLSKSELARKIGVSPQVYQRYESNRLPAADIIVKLSTATNVQIDWLLRGVEPMVPAGQMTGRKNIGENDQSGCRIPAECDLPGKLEAMKKEMAEQGKQLDDIRKLLLSLLAEERGKDADRSKSVVMGEKAG